MSVHVHGEDGLPIHHGLEWIELVVHLLFGFLVLLGTPSLGLYIYIYNLDLRYRLGCSSNIFSTDIESTL
jgi:hypothetical protein